jgi:hypothetical protein
MFFLLYLLVRFPPVQALKSNQHKVLAAGEVIATHIRVNLMAREFKGNTGCRLLGHLGEIDPWCAFLTILVAIKNVRSNRTKYNLCFNTVPRVDCFGTRESSSLRTGFIRLNEQWYLLYCVENLQQQNPQWTKRLTVPLKTSVLR